MSDPIVEEQKPKEEKQENEVKDQPKSSSCENLECKATLQALTKELEELKLKCTELETNVDNKEQESAGLLNTIAMLTNQNEVHRNDFEDERKDRERAHFELEQLKRKKMPQLEELVQRLQDELKKKNTKYDSLKEDFATLQANCATLWDTKVKNDEDIGILQDDNYQLNRKFDSYKYDLMCSEARVHDFQEEIMQLRQIVAKATPEMNHTLQDQLDIATMMNESLKKDKEKADMIIAKLQNDVRILLRQQLLRHESNGHDYAGRSPKDSDYTYDQPMGHANAVRNQAESDHTYGQQASHNYAGRNRKDSEHIYDKPTGRSSADLEYRDSDHIFERNPRRSSSATGPRNRHPELDLNTERPFQPGDESQERYQPVISPCQPPVQSGACASSQDSRFGKSNFYIDDQPYGSPEDRQVFKEQQTASSFHDNIPKQMNVKYTKALEYISVEMGDMSEEERTSLKQLVDESEYSPEKDLDHDIEFMCEKMKELRHDRQENIKTDIQRQYDPNLTCPKCGRQFRHGEIQKYRKHVNECT